MPNLTHLKYANIVPLLSAHYNIVVYAVSCVDCISISYMICNEHHMTKFSHVLNLIIKKTSYRPLCKFHFRKNFQSRSPTKSEVDPKKQAKFKNFSLIPLSLKIPTSTSY